MLPSLSVWRWGAGVCLGLGAAVCLLLLLRPEPVLLLQQSTGDAPGRSQALLQVSNVSGRGVIFEWHLESETSAGWSPVAPQPVFAGFPTFLPGNESHTLTSSLPTGLGPMRFVILYSRTNLSLAERLVDRVAGRWQQRGGKIQDDAFTRFAHGMRFRQLAIPIAMTDVTLDATKAKNNAPDHAYAP